MQSKISGTKPNRKKIGTKATALFLAISLLFIQAPVTYSSEPVMDPQSGTMQPTVPADQPPPPPDTTVDDAADDTTTGFLTTNETPLSPPEEEAETNVDTEENVSTATTAPTPESTPTAIVIQVPSPLNNYTIKIQDQPGILSYKISYSDNLGSSWTVAVSNLNASGTGNGEITWEDANAITTQPTMRFYKVDIVENATAALNLALNDLAPRIPAAPNQISIVSIERVMWRNTCLEVNTGGPCLTALVPGYRMRFSHEGTVYEYHTNKTSLALYAGIISQTNSMPENSTIPTSDEVTVSADLPEEDPSAVAPEENTSGSTGSIDSTAVDPTEEPLHLELPVLVKPDPVTLIRPITNKELLFLWLTTMQQRGLTTEQIAAHIQGLKDFLAAYTGDSPQFASRAYMIRDLIVVMNEGVTPQMVDQELVSRLAGIDSSESLPPQVAAITATIKTDLANSFGFAETELDYLIQQGLVTIEVDLENLKATVTIDPSVKLPDGAVNLADPIGSDRLPARIDYTLAFNFNEICTLGGPCYRPLHLVSANYQVEGRFYELFHRDGDVQIPEYDGDNRLRFVKIYDGDPYLVCIVAPCPTGKLIKEIKYAYTPVNYIMEPGEADPVEMIQATINTISFGQAKDEQQETVISRKVDIEVFKNGNRWIKTVTDHDQEGNVIAVNTFEELMVCMSLACPSRAVAIHRTDAEGNVLSEIVISYYRDKAPIVSITVPGGNEAEMPFTSVENVLKEALRLEEIKIWNFTHSTTDLTGPERTKDPFTLNWQAIANATIYEIQESTTPDFSVVSRSFWPSGISETITPDKKGNLYYRVRGWIDLPENGGVSSQFSNVQKIMIVGKPPKTNTAAAARQSSFLNNTAGSTNSFLNASTKATGKLQSLLSFFRKKKKNPLVNNPLIVS